MRFRPAAESTQLRSLKTTVWGELPPPPPPPPLDPEPHEHGGGALVQAQPGGAAAAAGANQGGVGMTNAIMLRLHTINDEFEFYALQRRWARLRFHVGTCRRRTLDKICNDICPTMQHTVAFGAARFEHAMGGQRSGSAGVIRRHLVRKRPGRVCLVDEYNTSKMCSECAAPPQRLEHPRMVRHVNNVGDRRIPIYGLCQCQSGCHMLWNRDVNAAINIRNAFVGEIGMAAGGLFNNGQRNPALRPAHLSRQQPPPGGAGAGAQ